MCWKSKGRIRTKFISPLLETGGERCLDCLDVFHFSQTFHHHNLSTEKMQLAKVSDARFCFVGRKFKFLNNGVLNLLVKFKKKKY